MATPYETLGVDPQASQEDILAAYRFLAKRHHPDMGGGSDEKFIEVNKAYSVLSDPKKRKVYDEMGVMPDSPEMELLSDAITMISDVFHQAIDQLELEMFKRWDLLGSIAGTIEQARDNSQRKMSLLKSRRMKYEKMKEVVNKKVKRKKSSGLQIFDLMFNKKLAEVDVLLAPESRTLKASEKALELLSNYEFDRTPDGLGVMTRYLG